MRGLDEGVMLWGTIKNKGILGDVARCAAGLPLHSKPREVLCAAHGNANEPSSPHQHLGMHREHIMRT